MPKIDKSQFTKEQWRVIRDQRRTEKEIKRTVFNPPKREEYTSQSSFVLGNGVSRRFINLEELHQHGKIYGCNALYRTFSPDYLVAVDVKMVIEITRSNYQLTNELWTNPNKSFINIPNLKTFQPSKGWSSGPTALWLAAQHQPKNIYILGFDYQGLNDGKQFNNLYAGTRNYKKPDDDATFFGNWVRQTKNVIQENSEINFIRVIEQKNYCPPEFNQFGNYKTMNMDTFLDLFNLQKLQPN